MSQRTCGHCGTSSAGRTILDPSEDQHWWQKLPADIRTFDGLCRECANELNQLTAESMSDTELCAAIVHDSHGYATPEHAAHHVEAYRDGDETAWCERAGAVFDRDLGALIESAVKRWGFASKKEREALRERVIQWREVEAESDIAAMGLSMRYPVEGSNPG